jgi:hypothetical protein
MQRHSCQAACFHRPFSVHENLQDFVPKERRAAWNALESVTSFGWSGSAAFGGWLIHSFGFQASPTPYSCTALPPLPLC